MILRIAFSALVVLTTLFARADDPSNDATPDPDTSSADMASIRQEAEAAGDAARRAMVAGPTSIELRDQAKLALPAGFVYVPMPEAGRLMRSMGNTVGPQFIGLIFPESDGDWFVAIHFDDAGYVKDDDAKDWNADELLQSLKDGTEAGNEERARTGVPPMKVTRWIEPPTYDSATHRLVWSAEAVLRDQADPDPGVNYNTYALGRDGHISLNLITSEANVEANKPVAHELLEAIAFNDGKHYSDFNASTDKVAAYGLAALVAGVAAKKIGLLALIGAFVVKFAKVIALGAAAVGGSAWSRIRGSKSKDPEMQA
jgi:uncharacterized membrane-anchored protein